jgi:tRNA threonylcarbamoyladenosine biosynthesis protein TsaE
MLARELGVREVVQSPTFTILKSYQTSHPQFKTLVHMDAYRIEDLSELKPLYFGEILARPDTLFCIEWAEKIAPALPPHLKINISSTREESRTITVEAVM